MKDGVERERDDTHPKLSVQVKELKNASDNSMFPFWRRGKQLYAEI